MWDADRRSHHIAAFRFASRLAWDRIVRAIELLVVPLLLIGSLILIGIVIFRSFTWTDMAGDVHAAKDRISAENEIFRTLAQIFGGAFVLAGLYFSAKSFAVARQSEVTERLSSALENLGSDSNARRVGGINSLAGLLWNPSADYDGIVRTLCDFIRTETKSPSYREDFPEAPRSDVQAALSALGRRRLSYKFGEREHLNLRNAFLPNADLHGGNFNGAQFDNAILSGASFHRAHLRRASFDEASVDRANFNLADLRSARFYKVNAESATFRRAFLKSTTFASADLTACSFGETTLKRVLLTRAKLDDAEFERARLLDCDLIHVDLTHVDLQGTSVLRGCAGLPEPESA